VKDPLVQQLKSGATISHPFEQLQLVDFPFHQTVVLVQSQSRYNCRLVPLDPLDKALEFVDLAGGTFCQPCTVFFPYIMYVVWEAQ
jgi:hypothetical protein